MLLAAELNRGPGKYTSRVVKLPTTSCLSAIEAPVSSYIVARLAQDCLKIHRGARTWNILPISCPPLIPRHDALSRRACRNVLDELLIGNGFIPQALKAYRHEPELWARDKA